MKRYDPQHISDTLHFSKDESSTSEAGANHVYRDNAILESPLSKNPLPASAQELLDVLTAAIPPSPAEKIREENLPCIDGSVAIGRVAPGASFGFLKRIFLRFLRIITARQMDFNWHTAYVLRMLNEHTAQMNQAMGQTAQAMGQMAQQIVAQHSASREASEAAQKATNELARKQDEQIRSLTEDLGGLRQEFSNLTQAMENRSQDIETRAADVDHKFFDRDGRFQAIEQHLELVRSVQNQIINDLSERSRSTAEIIESLRSSQRRMLRVIQNDLEKLHQRPDAPAATVAAPPPYSPKARPAFLEDLAYQLYEDTWRGSAENIRKSQNEYIEVLKPHLNLLQPEQRIVLDIGCGRGEFLETLKEQGYEALGVDTNRAFAQLGQEAGQKIHLDDANHFLDGQPDNSLGGMVAFQVLEHLGTPVLQGLINLVYDKLAPGGVALFETLNPSVFAAYQWFFMDLSHQRFLPPQTLRFIGECAGLEHVETRLIHPVADYAKLQETGNEQEKENVRRLNGILFGPQDYFILFRKPQ